MAVRGSGSIHRRSALGDDEVVTAVVVAVCLAQERDPAFCGRSAPRRAVDEHARREVRDRPTGGDEVTSTVAVSVPGLGVKQPESVTGGHVGALKPKNREQARSVGRRTDLGHTPSLDGRPIGAIDRRGGPGGVSVAVSPVPGVHIQPLVYLFLLTHSSTYNILYIDDASKYD